MFLKMSITLKISPESEFLHVTATGEFSLQEAKRTFAEMMEAVARNAATKVVFDGRAVTGNPSTMERFYYGEFAANTVVACGVSGVTKFAYVLKIPVRDPERFGETVAVNRGMCVQTFDELSEALKWLHAAPHPQSGLGTGM
jgi:hypothetical protein